MKNWSQWKIFAFIAREKFLGWVFHTPHFIRFFPPPFLEILAPPLLCWLTGVSLSHYWLVDNVDDCQSNYFQSFWTIWKNIDRQVDGIFCDHFLWRNEMRTGTPVVEKCRLSEIIHFNQSISLHFVPSTLYNQTVRFICSGEFFSINLFHQCCPINFLRSIPVDTVAYYKHLSSVCDPPQTKKSV